MATKKDWTSTPFAKTGPQEEYADEADADLDEEISGSARRAVYRTKRDLQRKSVESGAETIYKKIQPYEQNSKDELLKADQAQVNFRAFLKKRDWAATYMEEIVNAIDKELLQDGYQKVRGRGKKSKGSDFVFNAFMDMIIALQEDQDKLELPEGFHDWLESLRAYLKVRRKHMNFEK